MDNLTKIVGAVIGAILIALQGANVKETSEISSELIELTKKQAELIEAIRTTQRGEILPELKKETADLDELLELGRKIKPAPSP